MTNIYTFLKSSFLGGGIDTKIFVDRKKLSYFGQCAFVFGAKKNKKTKKQFAFLFPFFSDSLFLVSRYFL